MNLQHRNQAPRPQNRHRFDFERKSLKKPEAPGSAGRCEKGTGRSTAPSLSPATLFHLSRCSYPGIFSTLPLWGRIRLLGLVAGRFPTLGRKPPHRATRGPTAALPVPAAGYKKAAVRFCGTAALCFMIRSAENLLLPPPPARRGTWPAGNPPVLWRFPSPLVGVDRAIQFICQAI